MAVIESIVLARAPWWALPIRAMEKAAAVTFAVSATRVTGSMRAIIAGAASGSSAALPDKLWPFVTVSRFVPNRSI